MGAQPQATKIAAALFDIMRSINAVPDERGDERRRWEPERLGEEHSRRGNAALDWRTGALSLKGMVTDGYRKGSAIEENVTIDARTLEGSGSLTVQSELAAGERPRSGAYLARPR